MRGPARKPVSLLCHGPSRVGRSQLKLKILEGGERDWADFRHGGIFLTSEGGRGLAEGIKKTFSGWGVARNPRAHVRQLTRTYTPERGRSFPPNFTVKNAAFPMIFPSIFHPLRQQ